MAALARLRKRAEFQLVYHEGWKAVGRYLVCFGVLTRGEEARLGVTATRKLGGAVVRNRCRRRVRELWRNHRTRATALGCDVVVNIRSGCLGAEWGALERDFLQCMSRLETLAGRRELP